jgi:flagellar L-ring protein precursor FlgH
MASAESLFRSGVSANTYREGGYTPRSFYAVPRAAQVGDIITIRVNERTQSNIQNTTNLQKEETITENSTNMINRIVDNLFGFGQVVPSIDGLNNSKSTDVTAKSQRSVNYTDTVTCQVVEVLPNGNLIVQGKKSVNSINEQQSLYVSGIINPFYLDARNQIASNQVGNFQLNLVGKGVVSRQQKEGHLGRLFQFLN